MGSREAAGLGGQDPLPRVKPALPLKERQLGSKERELGSRIVMDKVTMLKGILEQNPGEAFARYGLAMEYASQGQTDAALAEFGHLLTAHPDYTAGYFMAAQTLVKAGRKDEAKARLKEGLASAQRKGDQHALSEMQDLLLELE
jgi:predicted Zn-dependent protease